MPGDNFSSWREKKKINKKLWREYACRAIISAVGGEKKKKKKNAAGVCMLGDNSSSGGGGGGQKSPIRGLHETCDAHVRTCTRDDVCEHVCEVL